MKADDRLQALQDQSRVTGIDFVYVHPDQVHLEVYFLRAPSTLDTPLVGDLDASNVHIFSQSTPNQPKEIPIVNLSWTVIDGKDVLQLETEYPGDFSLYTLYIHDPKDPNSTLDPPRIDPYFNNITFSFKANCPSDLDCEPTPPECPPDEIVDFPINYQARDFWSFRQALFDFASQRYPDWKDRLEADVGVMLAEVMSALGDEMAYYQDRVAREAYLQTATQRRSIEHHASLVDYHMHNGAGAFTWLDIQAKGNGLLPAGMNVWTLGDNGLRVDFELGNRLKNQIDNEQYDIHIDRNELNPYCWDEDDLCLPIGATELYLDGHKKNILVPNSNAESGQSTDKWVLLKTYPDSSIAQRKHLVRLLYVENLQDPVFAVPITRIVWEKTQALPFELDMSVLKVHANILPATAGKTFQTLFVIGKDPIDLNLSESLRKRITRAIERQGPRQESTYLYSIPESENNPLVWLGNDSQRLRPEVCLTELDLTTELEKPDSEWTWRRSLLGDFASQGQDTDFSLESGTWKRVVGYQRIGQEIVHQDYANSAGQTVRFGDGEFGLTPSEGTVFLLRYRLGNGRRTNVAAGALTKFEDPLGIIATISNPFPGQYGLDEETPEQVRQLAPEAFRAVTFRAVRPEDYAEAAERLPWVQAAGASFRWTGSWLSAFVTPDPLGAVSMTAPQVQELTQQLDRFRQAGREAHVLDPVYADMDLEITICVHPNAYKGEVKKQVLLALLGKKGVRSKLGFFSADRFTFGTPLHRSALEAVIQSIEGVRAVERIRFRRRGWFNWRVFKTLSYYPGKNVIFRLENDARFPEQGSLKLIMTGGA